MNLIQQIELAMELGPRIALNWPAILAAVKLSTADLAQDDAGAAFSSVHGCLNDEMVAFGQAIKARKAALAAYRAAIKETQ